MLAVQAARGRAISVGAAIAVGVALDDDLGAAGGGACASGRALLLLSLQPCPGPRT